MWISWVAPKCNRKGPYKREARGSVGKKTVL